MVDDVRKKKSWKDIGANILNVLSGSVTPLIPLMMGATKFKMLVAVLGPGMLNVLKAESDLYTLFTFVGMLVFILCLFM